MKLTLKHENSKSGELNFFFFHTMQKVEKLLTGDIVIKSRKSFKIDQRFLILAWIRQEVLDEVKWVHKSDMQWTTTK